ncbi:unnamed protein product [Durusdinium trenchii]|uniref:Uncharacterized protein n=1 Tax=Durusdinium trenchii TaxID=1381693 RepID=A0ABP0QTL9_9DINO
MIVAISVGGCLSCICVGLYLYVQREKPLAVNVFGHQMQADGCPRSSDEHKGTFDSCRGGIPLEGFMEYAVSVGTEDREVVERSEGGYRTKRKVIPGQAAEESKPSKPSCLSRCLGRCYNRLCPKKQIRRIAPVSQENYGMLAVGARVRLIGLSQAHFNGLEGFITGGPNEKGRYTVDVIVDDDEMVREMQTLSFKADNLLVLPPEQTNSNQASNLPGRGPSSYRGGA